jgi:signal transduction histidine kinase/CheY-like chemotaxis protein
MSSPGEDGTAAKALRTLADELRDVNERLVLSGLREQEAHEQVERERRQLSSLLEALHDGVVITDGAGAFVMVNDAARRILGLDMGKPGLAEAARSSLDHRALDMRPLAPHEDPLARAVRGETFVDAESLLVRPGGEVRRLTTSGANTREAGEVALAITVLRDVTERHELEVRLFQNERLASIGTLAAGVAHEVNNPLSFVTTNIALVLEEVRALALVSPSPKLFDLQSMLLDAARGTERIARIVGGLTTFSRAAEEVSSVVDVRSVLDDSVDMAFNQIRHRAALVKDYGEVPLVDVDQVRLGQVFLNLLVNAAHALPEGAADRNAIRVVTSTDSAGRAVIEVRDTGHGIPQDVLPRIFDPFFTTKAVGIGTGLGLSICRNSVLAMKGEISVESGPATGTVFRIVLPAAQRDRQREDAAAPPSLHPISRRGLVLVVDDEESVGTVLRRALSDHEVTAVCSAAEALDLIASGIRYDVILSDLMMPGRSGMDLYETLSQCSPRDALRMVFVSGGAFTPGAAAFLERVPNERLAKPFELSAVRAIVQKFVGLA